MDYNTYAPAETDRMGGHTIEDINESYEMKVKPVLSETDDLLAVYFVLRDANDSQMGQIIRAVCNPSFPAGYAFDLANYDLIAQFDTGQKVTAFEVVPRSAVSTVIAAAFDPATSNDLHLFDEPEWGETAVSLSNKSAITALMPPLDTTGSFAGTNYNTAYTPDAIGPVIRGLVGRRIVAGAGMPTSTHGDVQIIFGVQSFSGGASIPLTAPKAQIVSTLHMLIPESSITVLAGGDFPLFTDGQARQMDEYEQGGVDPFIPLSMLPHPFSPSGDMLLLGRTGNKAQERGRDGNGGLALYRVKSQGNWSIRMCALVGFDWGSSESVTIGASAAFSTRTLSPDEDPVVIHVSRVHPDRSDKYSTIYVSPEEAASSGWTPETALTVTPVLRRNDRMSSVIWFNYKLTTRAFTDERTGPKIVTGDKYRYAINLRWSLPGSTQQPPP